MKNIIITMICFFVLLSYSLDAATACSATADNGRSCSVGCLTGEIAICFAGAKTATCTCMADPPPPGGGGGTGQYALTSFESGERAYFTDALRPFIISLESQAADDLAIALDQVIAAVDAMNQNAYNTAENNYHEKRLSLSTSEKNQLDAWVEENGIFN